MARQFASREQRKSLSEIFRSFDKQYDGVLTRDELIMGLSQVFGSMERAMHEVDEFMAKFDSN